MPRLARGNIYGGRGNATAGQTQTDATPTTTQTRAAAAAPAAPGIRGGDIPPPRSSSRDNVLCFITPAARMIFLFAADVCITVCSVVLLLLDNIALTQLGRHKTI